MSAAAILAVGATSPRLTAGVLVGGLLVFLAFGVWERLHERGRR